MGDRPPEEAEESAGDTDGESERDAGNGRGALRDLAKEDALERKRSLAAQLEMQRQSAVDGGKMRRLVRQTFKIDQKCSMSLE